MTYVLDGLIEAVDFNTFRTDLLAIYNVGFGDSGYGQIVNGLPGISGPVTAGDSIQSVEWDEFLDAADICTDHQGSSTTFPPNSEVAVDEIVEAHESDAPTSNPFDINGSLATLLANRLIAAGGSTTLFSDVLNSSRVASWTTQLVHQFRVTFTVVDDARYFFNSGGEIRFRGSRAFGSGTPQNAAWTALLASWTPIFNHTLTTAPSGGAGSAIGYYDLTGSFQTLATLTDSGSYALNTVTLQGRTVDGTGGANGDNGRDLEFRVEYNDGHSNPFFDTVDGTITSDIDMLKATTFLTVEPAVPATIFSTNIALTAGS